MMGLCEGLSRMSWKLSRTFLSGGVTGNGGSLLDQKLGKMKKPLQFSLKSGEPFGLAGLYETWVSPEKEPIHTCTIITTEPNDLLRPIHDRMPVIVAKQQEAAWIDPDNHNQKGLLSILKPYPANEMMMSEVDSSMLYRPKAQAPAYLNS
jgi:putative SOS response-associated peptidase YedK